MPQKLEVGMEWLKASASHGNEYASVLLEKVQNHIHRQTTSAVFGLFRGLVQTLDGYNLLNGPAFEGTLPLEENLVVTLTVVNTPTFELPATCGLGLLTVPIGIFGLLMCAAFLFLNRVGG